MALQQLVEKAVRNSSTQQDFTVRQRPDRQDRDQNQLRAVLQYRNAVKVKGYRRRSW